MESTQASECDSNGSVSTRRFQKLSAGKREQPPIAGPELPEGIAGGTWKTGDPTVSGNARGEGVAAGEIAWQARTKINAATAQTKDFILMFGNHLIRMLQPFRQMTGMSFIVFDEDLDQIGHHAGFTPGENQSLIELFVRQLS